MARWLLMALASALCADAGQPERYADYSAARMPQYDTVYDTPAASVPADDYHDRIDGAAAIDYNTYDQESNDKINVKPLQDEDVYQMPVHKNIRIKPTTRAIDDIDADYNSKSEDIDPKNRNSNIRTRNKIDEDEPVDRITKPNRNAKKFHKRAQDDDENDVSLEHSKEDKDSNSYNEKGKFVRRDIRQKVQRKSWHSKPAVLSDTDYDRSKGRNGKGANKIEGPLYSDLEMVQNVPNVEPDSNSAERVRPSEYKTGSDDKDNSEKASSQRHKAPMPRTRQKNTEYVDYNDMNKIEKIKNLPTESTKARTGASRRWSFQDGFRRRYFNRPPQEVEDYTEVLSSAQPDDAPAAAPDRAPAALTSASRPTTVFDVPIVPLSKDIIENITAFVNQSKQLSIAEKSQISIRKKAQKRDSVKGEMLKDKPPVLLQVTERLQTVVMVEPPHATQEPWLRARDIAEDSPERISKVKRFMRNKLVANARNISELMENWDDTVCDYVDISILDENGAVWMHTRGSHMFSFKAIGYILTVFSIFHLL